MPKYISVILVLILPFSLFQSAEMMSPLGIQLKEISVNSALRQNLSLDNPSLIESIVLLPDNQTYNEIEAAKMIMRLDNVPQGVLERAAEEGIQVRLFNEELTDFPTTKHLKGVTPRGYEDQSTTWDDVPGIGGSELVLVKIGYSEKGDGHGSINLELHEFAHSLDYLVFGDVRLDFRFLSIWEKEAPLLFPGDSYFLSYPEEYFAETFAMYFYTQGSRASLQEVAPLTFEYITDITSF
ncbi:MAG TPA: toxin [Bacillus sp. (in: firmicutes)]|uniref:anthrax toxin lethal factor-related metalloendopeptidase n=1 Tax=Bacillus litorisediminis TaxID=2922713 RepID=UPI001FAD3041|nr:toxin [Bacillus litorisediminis]HWO76304.1 toxin [Bacillus sp. (in: firmicutes)]